MNQNQNGPFPQQKLLANAVQQKPLVDTLYQLVKSMEEIKMEYAKEKESMSNTIRRLEM